ncbi:MAG: exonuclease SbcCD subunit D [Elusimicrobiaceae bacterium]|nr:exonuclease SbcCD subunit D [Elusimicrobiaceae bacterium]
MKIAHLSDLHLGKVVYNYSMLEEQKDILGKITDILTTENIKTLLIAGDIYDKSVPSAEAIKCFDEFLVGLSKAGVTVFIISGNHDSNERISFGADLMAVSGVHIAKPLTKSTKDIQPVMLQDEFGPVHIYMLPFIKPVHVKVAFETEDIADYTQALKMVIDNMHVDTSARNILITHQFVTGGARCESEQISVGGSDNVDSPVFEVFDYVALGHLHGPQHIGRETLRYCGSPLKYSFSEVSHKKSLTVINLNAKGDTRLEFIPLKPLHDWQEIKGKYNDLMAKDFRDKQNLQNFFHITLTDEEDVPDALNKLRMAYPNIMQLSYDNTRTASNTQIGTLEQAESKTPFEVFAEFYKKQNNQDLSEQQTKHISALIEKIWEEK